MIGCNDHQAAFSPHLASTSPHYHTHAGRKAQDMRGEQVYAVAAGLGVRQPTPLHRAHCNVPQHSCLCTVENNIHSFFLPLHPSHRHRLAEHSALANTLLSPSLFTRWRQSHTRGDLRRERCCLAARYCRHPARSASHHITFESPTKRVSGTHIAMSTLHTTHHCCPHRKHTHSHTHCHDPAPAVRLS